MRSEVAGRDACVTFWTFCEVVIIPGLPPLRSNHAHLGFSSSIQNFRSHRIVFSELKQDPTRISVSRDSPLQIPAELWEAEKFLIIL